MAFTREQCRQRVGRVGHFPPARLLVHGALAPGAALARAIKGIWPGVRQPSTTLPFNVVSAIVQRRLLPTPPGSGVAPVDLSDMTDDLVPLPRASLYETLGFDPARGAQDQPSLVARDQHSPVLLFSLRCDLKTYLA